mgnify:CR=1 FL=1
MARKAEMHSSTIRLVFTKQPPEHHYFVSKTDGRIPTEVWPP